MKRARIIFISLLLFCCTACSATTETTELAIPEASIQSSQLEYEEAENCEVFMQQIELSVKGSKGNVIGRMCYEIPTISNTMNSPNIEKINNALKEQCSRFFESAQEDFLPKVYQEAREDLQFENLVTSEIVNNDGRIFSIHQVTKWYAGGTVSFSDQGMTLDQETGERLFLPDFTDYSLDQFQAVLLDYLDDELNGKSQMFQAFGDWRSVYTKSSFEEYEFYYANNEIYIAIDSYITSEAPKIVVWSTQDDLPVGIINGATPDVA